jgi:hypothetical protein|tara:strand:+ start:58 stop:564 length:507 start_codon:yes stop_codon:yes gene_type:complete
MANNAVGSLSASILNDVSKMSLAGGMSFAPRDANDLWVYKEIIFDSASEPVIRAGIQFEERIYRSDGTELETHASDTIKWLAIKNTGTTDGSTSTTEGIVVSLNGDAAAFDEVEGIYIGSGELWVSKFPSATTIAQLYAASVAVTNDVPSGTGSDVLCIVAAIVDNVA